MTPERIEAIQIVEAQSAAWREVAAIWEGVAESWERCEELDPANAPRYRRRRDEAIHNAASAGSEGFWLEILAWNLGSK